MAGPSWGRTPVRVAMIMSRRMLVRGQRDLRRPERLLQGLTATVQRYPTQLENGFTNSTGAICNRLTVRTSAFRHTAHGVWQWSRAEHDRSMWTPYKSAADPPRQAGRGSVQLKTPTGTTPVSLEYDLKIPSLPCSHKHKCVTREIAPVCPRQYLCQRRFDDSFAKLCLPARPSFQSEVIPKIVE